LLEDLWIFWKKKWGGLFHILGYEHSMFWYDYMFDNFGNVELLVICEVLLFLLVCGVDKWWRRYRYHFLLEWGRQKTMGAVFWFGHIIYLLHYERSVLFLQFLKLFQWLK
jgi:hypothetical protein